jgi:predicted nucleic acid-binding OB-fold protein
MLNLVVKERLKMMYDENILLIKDLFFSLKVIRLYQQEKTNLTQTENRIHDLENKIKQGQITADTSKTNWLNQVNQMIDQINEKFIDLFNTMGCKGEICLDIPESPVSKQSTNSLFFIYSKISFLERF